MMDDERFDIDVGYRDPDDLPRDDFPEDKPSPAEYEDDYRACELLAVGIAECSDYWAIGMTDEERAAEAIYGKIVVACADPGRFVDRRFTPSDYGGTDPEPLHHWQARAVSAALGLR